MLPKIANKPDEYNDYKFRTWEKLGYIDYVTQQEYAQEIFGSDSPQVSQSLALGSSFYDKFRADLTARGYTVEPLPISKYLYATKDVPLLTRVFRWYAKLLQIDHPYRIQDQKNPDLRRGYYLTGDHL